MLGRIFKYFIVFFVAVFLSANIATANDTVDSSLKDYVMVAQLESGVDDLTGQVGQLCPLAETDIIQLETAVSETLVDLEIVQGLLETLLIEDLTGNLLTTLDPILDVAGLDTEIGQLNTDINDTLAAVTALINNLELFVEADINEQCALAANICVNGQDLITTTDGLALFLVDSIDSILTLPVSAETLEDGGLLDLPLINDLLALLGGVTDPVLGDILGLDTDDLIALNLNDTLVPLLTQLTDLRNELLGATLPAVSNVVELSCSLPEDPPDPAMCGFVNDSPNCSDPNCSSEEIADGLTCEDFNENPEEFCGNEVSCENLNCEGTMACATGDGDGNGDVETDGDSNSPGAGGSGGDGCGSLSGPVDTSSIVSVFLPLIAIGGIFALRIFRKNK